MFRPYRQKHDYPFGMGMAERAYTLNTYRFGFNGQEKSSDVATNSYTAMYWQYETKLARRWNRDPVVVHQFSPYMCFAGNPIKLVDKNGDIVKFEDVEDDKKFKRRIKRKLWIIRLFGDKQSRKMVKWLMTTEETTVIIHPMDYDQQNARSPHAILTSDGSVSNVYLFSDNKDYKLLLRRAKSYTGEPGSEQEFVKQTESGAIINELYGAYTSGKGIREPGSTTIDIGKTPEPNVRCEEIQSNEAENDLRRRFFQPEIFALTHTSVFYFNDRKEVKEFKKLMKLYYENQSDAIKKSQGFIDKTVRANFDEARSD